MFMYSVFIVDDEVIVRDGIRGKINWDHSQFSFSGEAGDGEIALSMIQDLKPDILITDIKMPFMDGLELSRMVKKLLPWTRIIILSGHDEFEYAKKAISIGVEDYILKPFTAEELLESMNRAADALEKEKQRYSDVEKMKQALESASLLAQEQLLANIITGVIPGTEAVGSAADLHIDLIARYYTVLVSELQCSGGKGMDCFVEAKTRLLQISENNTKVISFFVSPERAVLILKNSRLENVEEESYNLANNVEHEVCSDPELSVVTAIGSTVDRITAISESYRSAMDLLRRSRFSGKSRILNAGDCAEDAAPAAGLQENDPLLERIRYADEREIVLIVEQYLSYINESHEEFTAAASYLLVDVIMSISKLAEDLGGDIRDVVPDILSRTFVTNAVRSREVFAAEMERVLRTVLLWRNSRTQGRYADVILRAKKYIGEHFSDPDICLLSTAKAVNMSPNHFSSVFSQECGMTYIEYLTSVRIDTAKKLLRNTSMRSSEIAYETGFSDPHYFSFIFKKNTGQSPQEFRGKKE